MKRALQSCSILLVLCAAAAHAQLYKWVGPDGKVTYSDTPPPASAKQVETKPLPLDGGVASDMPFELAEAVKGNPVTLYTTRDCAPCDEGRKLLTERGIPFTEKTVNSNEDIAQFHKAGGEGKLPFLIVGRVKEKAFEPGVWNSTLTSAGYPEGNRLPKSYRNPPPQATAPITKSAPEKQKAARGDKTPVKPQATELPPATGNAPPGFRF